MTMFRRGLWVGWNIHPTSEPFTSTGQTHEPAMIKRIEPRGLSLLRDGNDTTQLSGWERQDSHVMKTRSG
ncbi:MAG TPA: hypothetical protein PLJ27_11500 [Polyangiaceae bacterium]|nr:hypothetical protein [Polyangiaceae bacterium]HNZ25348.1 hypothetical protein [Polyangiaceae bacterium]HOD24285.1 hypothetical protein [Polyangiaceae bacterium]HOE50806.1 hypothetical protein [Polyangiaceae bacterium]HOH03484.1 hypothetical protein [Polyangiaceae bacterium]